MPTKLPDIDEEADELSQHSDAEEKKADFTAVKNFCEAKTTGKARLYTEKEQRQAVSRIEAFLIDRRLR